MHKDFKLSRPQKIYQVDFKQNSERDDFNTSSCPHLNMLPKVCNFARGPKIKRSHAMKVIYGFPPYCDPRCSRHHPQLNFQR